MPYNSNAKKIAANKKSYEKRKQKLQEEKQKLHEEQQKLQEEQKSDVNKYEKDLYADLDEMIRRYEYFKADEYNEDEDVFVFTDENEVDDKGVSLKEIRAKLKKIIMCCIIHRKIAYEEKIDHRFYNSKFNMDITQKEMDEMVENGTLINT